MVEKGKHRRRLNELPEVSSVPETCWAYLAGLIDGEGHIKTHKRITGKFAGKRMYAVHVANMNREMLEKINNDTMRLGSIYTRFSKAKKGEGFCVSYQLTYWAGPLTILLPKVIPYLIYKKHSAELMLGMVKLAVGWKPQRAFVQNQIAEFEKQLNYEFDNVIHKQRKEHSLTLEEAKAREKELYGCKILPLATRAQPSTLALK